GLATARFLADRGASVLATDEKPKEEVEGICRKAGIASVLEIRSYGPACLADVDLIVPSPGVPPSNQILQEALRRKIAIISEIELAYRFLTCPIIAVTGTNGKTTTTTLIGNILERAGMKVFVGGNIGDPLIGFVGGGHADYAVVEVSSFQLQWVEQFCPFVAILLNTTCDHVNYHGTFAAYRLAKERIFENQTSRHLAIINADEPAIGLLARKIVARIGYFSSASRREQGMFVGEDELVYIPFSGARETYPLHMVKIPGRHNLENVMASIMAARECGVSSGNIIAAITDFKGLPHRIELAGEKRGVAYYDDSKGTNVGAVVRALESFSRPVFLLMGGRDKDGDFETLAPLIKEKVKQLVLFGEARDRINGLIGGIVKTASVAGLREATALAYDLAEAGDIVLLSPGCASFDEFSDYKARGDFFKKLVGDL
ncbi:MAG: UDP-N-acetylmuramoyl-L-alanine--D-glutamate ligase, partial [Syntrophales bacterium LBB04]|nr:UDP-N-acetylmuramoyl-L-alanine--D-glutamate ligase [Syntrophales bacterium LBB04]